MYLLRRITNADGTLKKPEGYFEHLAMKYANPNTVRDLVTKAYFKYVENQPMDVGKIVQKIGAPDVFGFIYGVQSEYDNLSFEVDIDVPREEVVEEELQNFYEFHNLFYGMFHSKTPPLMHGFVLKKEGGRLIFMDPHGMEMGDVDSTFTPEQFQALQSFFPGVPIEFSPCEFQGDRNVCALWALLFLSYREKTHFEIYKMVENLARSLGVPFPNNGRFNDLVVIMIFEEFVENGFADATEIAKYPQGEYLNGLGRCRKCGLPKQVRNNQKRIPRLKTDSFKGKK